MNITFLPYCHQSINENDIESVIESLKKETITRGESVQAFEKALANYCGVSFAVVFNSGTTALTAAYYAAEVKPADRIITTPNTFIGTIAGAVQYGSLPQYIDVDRETGNLDLAQLESTVSYVSTRGRMVIVPVHFSGIALDMQRLNQQLRDPNVLLIEDAAHAIGSSYPDGSKVGSCSWSHMTVFSFHPAKTITTGEGGMVTTNDPELYQRLCLYRNNGIVREGPQLQGSAAFGYYEVQAITGNYHMTDFQAALGLSQLKRLDLFADKRRTLVRRYRKNLKPLPYCRLFTDKFDEHTAFHLFVVQIDFPSFGKTRENVMERLKQEGIGTQVHYIPLYNHPYLKSRQPDLWLQFPEMETYYAQTLSLPLYYDLSLEDVDRVCATLKTVLES